MARDSGGGVGSVLKWGLLIGGGYFAYRAITSAASTSGSGATAPSLSLADLVAAIKGAQSSPAPAGTTPAAAVKPTEPAPAQMITALKAAAAGNSFLVAGKMNQDQWNYYRNQLWPPDLSGAQLSAAFPNGPEQLTAEDFVGRLQSVGLAGLGLGRVTVPVPVLVRTPAGPVVVWAARDLPGSGAPRVAVFPAAHPFGFGPRPLPAENWQRQG
jgi:hypothetical protein